MMPQMSQPPKVHGQAPVEPPLSGAQHRDRNTEAKRLLTFVERQCPGVFTPEEFAGAGFFLPEQPGQNDVGDVRVVCWYCGVGLDQRAEGDVLEEEHLGNSCDWRQQSGGCRWGLFLRDQRRYTAGLRVQHARRSSRAEKHRPTTIWRDTRMRGE